MYARVRVLRHICALAVHKSAHATLFRMFSRHTVTLLAVLAIGAILVWTPASPAVAVSLADQAEWDRVELDSALERLALAQTVSAEVDARVEAARAELDAAVAQEAACQARLQSRAVALYRSGDDTTLSLLLGATDIPDLISRFELLERLARGDAQNIDELQAARAEAVASAEELLEMQAEQAQVLEELAAEVAAARAEFAASEAALAEYEARLAAAREAAKQKRVPPPADNPDQNLGGAGEWLTAVASHYGRNFTGRGASGEAIGPYSMMVAHKTLPFGTLIEFEYQGKRCVAKVADRGPYTPGREFDLGPGVVRMLDFNGVHEVRYRIIS